MIRFFFALLPFWRDRLLHVKQGGWGTRGRFFLTDLASEGYFDSFPEKLAAARDVGTARGGGIARWSWDRISVGSGERCWRDSSRPPPPPRTFRLRAPARRSSIAPCRTPWMRRAACRAAATRPRVARPSRPITTSSSRARPRGRRSTTPASAGGTSGTARPPETSAGEPRTARRSWWPRSARTVPRAGDDEPRRRGASEADHEGFLEPALPGRRQDRRIGSSVRGLRRPSRVRVLPRKGLASGFFRVARGRLCWRSDRNPALHARRGLPLLPAGLPADGPRAAGWGHGRSFELRLDRSRTGVGRGLSPVPRPHGAALGRGKSGRGGRLAIPGRPL